MKRAPIPSSDSIVSSDSVQYAHGPDDHADGAHWESSNQAPQQLHGPAAICSVRDLCCSTTQVCLPVAVPLIGWAHCTAQEGGLRFVLRWHDHARAIVTYLPQQQP